MIFGASSGIGAATAVAYAEHGAKVVIVARRLGKLEELKAKIEANGGEVLAIECDVISEESVKNAVKKIKEVYGKVDILFNNAGIAQRGSVEQLTVDEWDYSMNVNVRSIMLTSKYILPMMKERKFGKIVNTTSINAVLFDKGDELTRHVYNASKAAVIGLTGAMGATYAKHGITVNSVGPGLFETEMTENTLFAHEGFMNAYKMLNPVGRAGNMEEVVGVILFLSSPASNYCVGEYIRVDGGLSRV